MDGREESKAYTAEDNLMKMGDHEVCIMDMHVGGQGTQHKPG